MGKAYANYFSNEMLVLRLLEKEKLTKAQIQQRLFDASQQGVDLTMGLLTHIIIQLYQNLMISSDKNSDGESVYSLTDYGREEMRYQRMEYEKSKRNVESFMRSNTVVNDNSISGEDAYFENMFYIFYTSNDYAAVEGALHKVVREAFRAGWIAAVNQPDFKE